MSFQNCSGVIPRLCQGRGFKDVFLISNVFTGKNNIVSQAICCPRAKGLAGLLHIIQYFGELKGFLNYNFVT